MYCIKNQIDMLKVFVLLNWHKNQKCERSNKTTDIKM